MITYYANNLTFTELSVKQKIFSLQTRIIVVEGFN